MTNTEQGNDNFNIRFSPKHCHGLNVHVANIFIETKLIFLNCLFSKLKTDFFSRNWFIFQNWFFKKAALTTFHLVKI